MNLGFYGHTHTTILNYNAGGEYKDTALPAGIRIISLLLKSIILDKRLDEVFNEENLLTDEFRKEYHEMQQFSMPQDKKYNAITRYLGHKEGTTPNNIFSQLPQDPSVIMDGLVVWDSGYGGLDVPTNADKVLWVSEKSIPEKQQFEKNADKCFLFIDGSSLRSAGAMISRQISWERTATELVSEIQLNPAINHLLDAKYIFITLDVDGGVFIMKRNGKLEASLMITHGGAEGAIKEKLPGAIISDFGVMSLFLIQLFDEVFSYDPNAGVYEVGSEDVEFDDYLKHIVSIGLKDGITAVSLGTLCRYILEVGESMVSAGYKLDDDNNLNVGLTIEPKKWNAFEIPLKEQDGLFVVPEDWIVTAKVGDKKIEDVAFEYVQKGAKIIEGLPQLTFGNFTTIDRWEIESYQNIRNLILGYAFGDSIRPLSIAVFGSPGSGKSFGVTEIAKNILPGKVQKLEFNVSQFISVEDLSAAFQKVRDVVLEGKLPLVFFDEFDSDKDGMALGWIKSFLMPMQDGRFRDGAGEHPLGKCILVFAGGTAVDFDSFANPTDQQYFKNIKGPDFLSRLRGTISILGPNPKDDNDKNYVLRRALLLRSLCQRKLNMTSDGIAPVADGIIRAILTVPKFNHGARSMEAILDMSRIEGDRWEPAALPFHSQLALHVDADAFINAVKS
ncbi:MAG: AAA family ATPase [Defluviitaleaceae bacterium]|nr:AAA family ATPase [Defluviitaleaceae bacterium]